MNQKLFAELFMQLQKSVHPCSTRYTAGKRAACSKDPAVVLPPVCMILK
jgi:hypothetical protein